MKTMNILHGIRWGIEAWEQNVTSTTISNCWVKARVLGPKFGPQSEREAQDSGWKKAKEQDAGIYNAAVAQIGDSITLLAHQARIKSAMDIQTFLNPADEVVEDSDHQIFEDITEAYSKGNRLYESDEEDVIVPKIGTKEALEALQTLQLHEEQQDSGDSKLLSSLNLHKEVLQNRHRNVLRQGYLDH